jgi:hypothetical protein
MHRPYEPDKQQSTANPQHFPVDDSNVATFSSPRHGSTDIDTAARVPAAPSDIGPAGTTAPTAVAWKTATAYGFLAFLSLAGLQRASLSWWLRWPAAAFAVLMVIGFAFCVTKSDRAAGWVVRAGLALVVAVGVSSVQPFWSSVPTSGTRPARSFEPASAPAPQFGDSPGASTPEVSATRARDPQNTNPLWIPCKARLRLAAVSDYALNDVQEASVVACVLLGP